MVLQKKFQTPPTTIANYDYIDPLALTGTNIFYGGTASISGSDSYNLLPNAVYPSLSGSAPAAGATTTYNFDSSEFNDSRIVEGTGYASVSVQNGAGNDLLFFKVQLQKWDGTTATNLTDELSSDKIPADNSVMLLIDLPITTSTEIKFGEQLRFVVTAEAAAGVVNPRLFHDPKNRAMTEVSSTVLELGVPFRIDR